MNKKKTTIVGKPFHTYSHAMSANLLHISQIAFKKIYYIKIFDVDVRT